jgi:acyl-CoA dehydrogenase
MTAALGVAIVLGALVVLGVAVAALPPIRRRLVTPLVMRALGRALPKIGATERIALEAGTVWWDGDLFSGDPDWGKLLQFQLRKITARERAFLDGPVEELCAMLDEERNGRLHDLPPDVWLFLKRQRFFGMIIPEAHGGLGFSTIAHSAVITKIASRSLAAAVTVMVPNSLGPAELLLAYGTDEQKRRYLPRLATGQEIPCFALTGPEAGSDAAATESTGIVCHATFDGREGLGIRLTWRKRYTTLGPIATLIGLAFRLYDPEHLLGGAEDLGITCALVPAHLPGIDIGKRHDPMGVPFQNGPTSGSDVLVPLDAIIGGPAGAGAGWRMLMETLAAGRAISLPALSVAGVELATRVTGAYATVREQFDLPIGRFEGIEEPLARLGGMTYLMNAARVLTAGAVDAGQRPAVVSAIVKAYLTEGMRTSMLDAMDIVAGAGVCRGPRNLLAEGYASAPIAITVEGANILTRSLIIYGQGGIRCHPHVLEEMQALEAHDVARFDRAFCGHLGFLARNAARAFGHGLFAGRLGGPRGVPQPLRGYLARLGRMSAAFAVISDAAMATLGGQLKRREKLSGRLADALAWMYLGSAACKRFWDDGRREDDLPFLRWACEQALFRVDQALRGFVANFPNRPVAWLLHLLVFPVGRREPPPGDALGSEVARSLLEGRPPRERLTSDIYLPPPQEIGLGRLEAALAACVAARPAEAKLREAVRGGRLDPSPRSTLAERALAAGVIGGEERQLLAAAERGRAEAIEVDAFDDLTARTTEQRLPSPVRGRGLG